MTEKLKNPFKINELITAVNSLVDEKQDLISDLSTIRSGAALGATALQSITSSNVTTALGYTPYDSTNPNGYITNSALTPYVSSVNNISPVNGNVTLSIPTVNNPTITFTQGGTTKGTFTLNQSVNETIELDAGGGGGSITVDSVMSSTSENPVQNKVIYVALNNKQDTSNLVTSISSSSTDAQYPSAKCVYDIVGDIESTLDAIIAQGS